MNTTCGESREIETAVEPRRIFFRMGNPQLPAIIVVAGYCQSVVSLIVWLYHYVLTGLPHTIIAVERMGIGTRYRPTNLGRWGMQRQLCDLVAIFEALIVEGLICREQKVVWIGHSLGAHLSAEMCRLYPHHRALLLAAIPLVPGALLLNPWLWLGGFPALPMSLYSWLSGKGSGCPRWTSWLLFAGWRASWWELKRYFAILKADAGVIFFQVLLGYGWLYGQGLRSLKQQPHRVAMVGCRSDWIMPNWAMQLTAWWLKCSLLWIETAHCSTVHNPNSQTSGQTLRSSLDRLLS